LPAAPLLENSCKGLESRPAARIASEIGDHLSRHRRRAGSRLAQRTLRGIGRSGGSERTNPDSWAPESGLSRLAKTGLRPREPRRLSGTSLDLVGRPSILSGTSPIFRLLLALGEVGMPTVYPE
jgi:hypothetical protein